MSMIDENIKRINGKLQQLLKQLQILQKENEKLNSTVLALNETREKDTLNILQLQQQVGILKSAAGQMTEADKKSFEKNINQYLREIDKCIGLLSE